MNSYHEGGVRNWNLESKLPIPRFVRDRHLGKAGKRNEGKKFARASIQARFRSAPSSRNRRTHQAWPVQGLPQVSEDEVKWSLGLGSQCTLSTESILVRLCRSKIYSVLTVNTVTRILSRRNELGFEHR
eukprot:gene2070-biopygen36